MGPEMAIDEALHLGMGERQTSYGHPRDHHGKKGAPWNA